MSKSYRAKSRSYILRNTVLSVKRYRAVLVFVVLGLTLMLILSAIVGQTASRLSAKLSKGSAISAVKVDSVSPHGETKPITAASVSTFGSLPRVVSVDIWDQQGLTSRDDQLWNAPGVPEVFWATPQIEYLQPKVLRHSADLVNSGLTDSQIILPDKVGAKSYESQIGKAFEFQYIFATGASTGEGRDTKLTVVGVYDNSVPGMDGLSAAYVSKGFEAKLIAAKQGISNGATVPQTYVYRSCFVLVADASHVAEVQNSITSMGFYTTSIASQVSQLPGLLILIGFVNLFIAALLAMFIIGLGFSIAGAW